MNNSTDSGALFAMTSITYAQKAQSLLRQAGIGCEIVKTPKELAKGCGYSIKVFSNAQGAKELLKGAGITIKGIAEL